MSLSAIGLSEAHEKLYRAALAGPAGTVPPEVAARYPGADELLADLRELGLLGGPDGRRANPPSVLEDVADQLADDLASRQRAVARSRVEIAELAHAFERHASGAGAAAVGVEALPDSAAVRERIDELSFFARHSIFSVQPVRASTPPVAPAPQATRCREDERALRRGLDVRVVVNHPVAPVPGTRVRVLPGELRRVIVIDDDVAVVASGSAGGALVVRQPGLLAVVLGYAEQLWRLAGEAQPRPEASPEDRRLLELLAGGATDETMARALGVSSRQARRRVARLMVTLGVTSRFAAGAEAARRGWL